MTRTFNEVVDIAEQILTVNVIRVMITDFYGSFKLYTILLENRRYASTEVRIWETLYYRSNNSMTRDMPGEAKATPRPGGHWHKCIKCIYSL